MKQCLWCGQTKPLDEFTVHPHGEHGRRPECNECRSSTRRPETVRSREARNARQAVRREQADEIKLDAGCLDCGYREHAIALDFDHRPGETKARGGVSALVKSACDWAIVLAEIAKCDVVCANCHRVRTKARGDWTPGRLNPTTPLEG